MFQISTDQHGNGKGMIMSFPNGYEVSIQFGIGNYCDNRFADKLIAYKSSTCETAIFKPNGRILKYKGESVQGWQTAEEVAELIEYVKNLQSNNYGRAKQIQQLIR